MLILLTFCTVLGQETGQTEGDLAEESSQSGINKCKSPYHTHTGVPAMHTFSILNVVFPSNDNCRKVRV